MNSHAHHFANDGTTNPPTMLVASSWHVVSSYGCMSRKGEFVT